MLFGSRVTSSPRMGHRNADKKKHSYLGQPYHDFDCNRQPARLAQTLKSDQEALIRVGLAVRILVVTG